MRGRKLTAPLSSDMAPRSPDGPLEEPILLKSQRMPLLASTFFLGFLGSMKA